MGPARWSTACLIAAAATTVGCAGSRRPPPSDRAMAATPAADAQPAPPQQQPSGIDPEILPPASVPRQGSGPARRADARVIRAWLRALRHGDIPRAASYFAIPSRFQNGTPVLTLDTPTEVLAVNVSFPCGAVATRLRRAGRFTLVRFRLTRRINGDCRGAEGNTTGGAIRVSGGRIREWYRLYDADEAKPGPAQIDPGTDEA